jgi:hypothetical protein
MTFQDRLKRAHALRQLCQVANGPKYHLADISPSHGHPLNLEKQRIQAKE